MKYLFLLIRHLFPRKKKNSPSFWREIRRNEIYESRTYGVVTVGWIVELKDQYGNIKIEKFTV